MYICDDFNYFDSKGRLIARWSEDVVFCETKEHILEGPHVALLLELLVLPTTASAQPPCPIAWGIILPSKISLNETVAIQLYRIPKRFRAAIKVIIRGNQYVVNSALYNGDIFMMWYNSVYCC